MSTRGAETGHGFDTSRPMGSFFEVVREVLLNPRGFFAGVSSTGGGHPGRQRAPVIFSIACSYIAQPLIVLSEPLNRRLDVFAPAGSASNGGFFSLIQENLGPGIAVAIGFLVLLPFIVLAGAYIGSAIQHLFVMLFVRDRGTFYDTFPAGVYGMSAIGLFSWVPILGYLVSLYGIYVTTVGLKEMHGTTRTRALLAALGPTLIFVLLALPAILGLGAPAGPR